MESKSKPLTVEAAAIRDTDGKVYQVPKPGRHHNVIQLMSKQGCKRPVGVSQGFVLSDGSFVGREKAREWLKRLDSFFREPG